VSNASSVEVAKFLNHLRLVNATINDPMIMATNAYILKAAVNGTSNIAGSAINP
jgi:hypothetical protein